jgi:benzylsuccinate CoA-transferase BbsE subunit
MSSFLGHLLVLDLADGDAAYSSRFLAALGADIIKIEKPGGDPSREAGPLYGSGKDKISLSFLYNNAGKKDITLDLEKKPGRDIFRRLAASADIIIEAFSPGYLKRKHLDYTRLSILNPRLIMASITPFGSCGPQKDYAADDAIVSAAAGLTYLHGYIHGRPLNPVDGQPPGLASLYAVSAILLAVQNRNATGKGQSIDISQQASATSTLINAFLRYFSEGIVTHRNGKMRWDNLAGIFPCRDGFIFLTFDREWDILMDLMAADNYDPGLGAPEWKDPVYRQSNSGKLVEAISGWTRSYKVAQLFEIGQSMRFPWAPVWEMASLIHNPQLESRCYFSPLDYEGGTREMVAPGMPFEFDGERGQATFKTPSAGEHNLEIFGSMLHLSEKEIAGLKKANVI